MRMNLFIAILITASFATAQADNLVPGSKELPHDTVSHEKPSNRDRVIRGGKEGHKNFTKPKGSAYDVNHDKRGGNSGEEDDAR